jgi:DsbC/DsbD-like thiol-disulfide interchange protein
MLGGAGYTQGSRLPVIYSVRMKKYGLLPLLLLVGGAAASAPSVEARTVVPMPLDGSGISADIRPVHWSVLDPNVAHAVVAGRAVPVTIEASIAKGWHIYSLSQKPGGPIPLTIRLIDSGDAVIRGVIKAPKPERHFDKNFGIETELYSGNPRFTVQIAVPPRSAAGTRSVQLGARYQVCSETLCLPARTDKLEIALRVAKHP